MNIADFDFYLPKNLIADFPQEPRDYARLLVFDKKKSRIIDEFFFNLPNYLNKGDVLVLNSTKVFQARYRFFEENKEREIFFLENKSGVWKALVRPGRCFKAGKDVYSGDLHIHVEKVCNDGIRELSVNMDETALKKFLARYGEMPVPPYIEGKKYNISQYNTVYSKKERSVAAPTAGLHFTKQLLSRLKAKGVKIEFVNLDVGLGTFLPVKVRDFRRHKMHSENYEIDFKTAKNLNKYISEGRRIVASGTTVVRVLEDNFRKYKKIVSGSFTTNIFISPGFEWKVVNALITNFHLPKSTLIMLVAAFVGQKRVMTLYEHAKKLRYRFYSFGDGMFIY